MQSALGEREHARGGGERLARVRALPAQGAQVWALDCGADWGKRPEEGLVGRTNDGAGERFRGCMTTQRGVHSSLKIERGDEGLMGAGGGDWLQVAEGEGVEGLKNFLEVL